MKSNYQAKSLGASVGASLSASVFTSVFAVTAALVSITSMVACSNSVEKIEQSSAEKPNENAVKALAEAEAAEEAFAKESSGKSKGSRGVASVKKAKKASSKTASNESIFVVQVGTFKVEENAKKLTEKLKAAGLPVVQKKIEREGGVVLYAVRFEPTPNRVEAEKFVSTVKAATGEASLIMSVGN